MEATEVRHPGGIDDGAGSSAQLLRVSDNIAEPIKSYFRFLGEGQSFHMTDLLEHVRTEVPFVAPDSPGRIMRDLRTKGVLGYTLINRRASEYMISRVPALQ